MVSQLPDHFPTGAEVLHVYLVGNDHPATLLEESDRLQWGVAQEQVDTGIRWDMAFGIGQQIPSQPHFSETGGDYQALELPGAMIFQFARNETGAAYDVAAEYFPTVFINGDGRQVPR